MIEWPVTPIEAFNRNKRRLDTGGREMEGAEVMDPQGPSVTSRGYCCDDSATPFRDCLHCYELLQFCTAIKS